MEQKKKKGSHLLKLEKQKNKKNKEMWDEGYFAFMGANFLNDI